MNENRLFSMHYILRAVILLGFSSYIVYLVETDYLQYYIAPRMMIFVKGSAIALYAVACFQGYSAFRAYRGKRMACDCEQPASRSSFRNIVSYGLLILPLLVGFLLPDSLMGSSMASAKGMNLSAAKMTVAKKSAVPANETESSSTAQASSGNENTDSELEKMFHDEWEPDLSKIGMWLYKKDSIDVKEPLYREILSTIDLFKNHFVGRKIEISGFVYRETNMKSSQFVVGRFVFNCCSADAMPYGVMIDYPTAQNFAKDTWVKVTGTTQIGNYDGNEIITIKASQIEEIDAPASPYIYPNYDPLQDLD
ncbi:TIGR03943 family putative permease subunit [Paenibacillus sp. GCM10027629]|uniref:TIGR03943 family putative permease subunit n=1 Tax=Paenibacillus sp. GCM10027629 TaxID=3273414 RepID=UPI003644DA27